MVAPAAWARVPLFERLADDDPASVRERAPRRMLDREGLRASVGRELLRLMNRRSAARPGRGLTVLDYGLPDWTGLYAANPDDRLQIARTVLRALRAFEPRLHAPQVQVEPSALGAQSLLLRLTGSLGSEGETWPVQFCMLVGPSGSALLDPEGVADGA